MKHTACGILRYEGLKKLTSRYDPAITDYLKLFVGPTAKNPKITIKNQKLAKTKTCPKRPTGSR